MLKLKYSKNFIKNYRKRIVLNKSLDRTFQKRLQLFLQDPSSPILKNHKLSGIMKNLSAFSVRGDIRVIYYIEKSTIYLIDIGTHNQVY